ncbi:MAG: hypothetical protein ACOCZ6_05635 [Nanoarchaeota archaeon]
MGGKLERSFIIFTPERIIMNYEALFIGLFVAIISFGVVRLVIYFLAKHPKATPMTINILKYASWVAPVVGFLRTYFLMK